MEYRDSMGVEGIAYGYWGRRSDREKKEASGTGVTWVLPIVNSGQTKGGSQ